MDEITHGCFYENCTASFTGDKPEDWLVLEPHPPTYGPSLFYCPNHKEAVMQGLYSSMMEDPDHRPGRA
jgi:hypothetical protein